MSEDNDMHESEMTRREVLFGVGIACIVLLPLILVMVYLN